jgi:ethanolamine utilization protein EutN/carbon dioxide concentrating mechanism protein CcmL
MELARVLGSVTATAKAESLLSHKLLVVQPHDAAGSEARRAEVAVDTVGAGPGDQVLIVRGSAARQPPQSRAAATDLTIVAIVDSVDIPNRTSTRQEPTRTRTRRR